MKLALQIFSIIAVVAIGSNLSSNFDVNRSVAGEFRPIKKQRNLRSELNRVINKTNSLSSYKMIKVSGIDEDKLL